MLENKDFLHPKEKLSINAAKPNENKHNDPLLRSVVSQREAKVCIIQDFAPCI